MNPPPPTETASLEEMVELLRRSSGDRCFACGRGNACGLRMDGFATREGDITARFATRPDFQGTTGSLHGGVAAAALDEILVWAGILQEKVLTVTGKLELRYGRPLENGGEELEVRARVEQRRGRRLTVSGELHDADGNPAVSARGLYIVSRPLDELRAAYPSPMP